MNGIHAIEFVNVTKKFGEQTVLDNLNFEIIKGKITTILGFSGSGKSTILKHILKLLDPTLGEINVLGKSLTGLTRVQERDLRKRFGVLFQYAALFDSLTAIQNVAFPLIEFTKMTPEERHSKCVQLLDSVGLKKESYHKMPAELSGGMRKRVGLARALALDPEILLYDEPTTGLDPITTKMVNELIYSTAKNYKTRDLTSVIISHDIKATLDISDYVAFLDRGKIVEYSPVEKFVKTDHPTVKTFLELTGVKV